jgi:Na+/melibiose symporter-like transporter
MKKTKVRNPEKVGARELFGVTALSMTSSVTAIFMSTVFMTFMTDYAGLGAWGATLATALLLFARIVDAVDDPIQGFIMDNAKVGKWGKYKPFFLISIIMTTIGVVALYALPQSITQNRVLVGIWVIVFYLCYDIGTSFYNQNILYRTMTTDVRERSRLAIWPAMFVLLLGAVSSGLLSFIVKINERVGSYNRSFMLVVGSCCLVSAFVSVIGWFCVREKHIVVDESGEKTTVKDFFNLLKENRAMLIHVLKSVFSGFVWTLLFATPTYYVKWGFCTDLATGEVDMTLMGIYGMIVAVMMLLPTLIGNLLGTPLLRIFKGDPIKVGKFNLSVQAAGGLFLYISQITGLLENNPAIFFICLFVIALACAADSIPQATVEMELMDYTIYRTGKDRSALTGVLSQFLKKAQNAISSALVGAVLIAIGYNVDSVTGNYVGDISAIPRMLNSFIVIMGLVPAVLAVIAIVVYHWYPLTNSDRAEMTAALNRGKTE